MKVVVRDLKAKTSSKKLPVKRVRDDEGRRRTLLTVDADSRSFGQDFQAAFARSVRKARRDNKKITGRTDVVVVKS